MSDDDILRTLGEHARSMDQADDATAQQAGLVPLDDAARSRMADRILASMSADDVETVVPPRSKVVRGPASWFSGRRVAVVAAPMAIAAAVLATVFFTGSADPTPEYAMVVTAGESAVRSAPAAPAASSVIRTTDPDGRVELVLRPATRTTAPVEAHAFFVGGGGEVLRWNAQVDVSPEGAVRVTAAARTLAGAREVRVVVVPAGTGRDAAEARARSRSGGKGRVYVAPVAPRS